MLVEIHATGRKSSNSRSEEVWLIGFAKDEQILEIETIDYVSDGRWTVREERANHFCLALMASGDAKMSMDIDADKLMLRFMRHPWSGIVSVQVNNLKRDFNLYGPENASPVEIYVSDDSIATLNEIKAKRLGDIKSNDIVGLAAPCWRGVFAATKDIFEHVIPIPANPDITPSEATAAMQDEAIETILASPAQHFVVSGGDFLFLDIVRKVRHQNPDKKFHLMFHGAFLALGMTLDRDILMAWIHATKLGDVEGIICVKRGMDELCRLLGAPAIFMPLTFPKPPLIRQDIGRSDHNRKLGMWLSRSDDPRKSCPALPYALGLVPQVELNAAGVNWPILSMAASQGVKLGWYSSDPIPKHLLRDRMAQMDLNLYITASECSPMLPLESLALGVPCLMGPVSYYFEDDAYLCSRLIVEDIADPLLIRDKIDQALAERNQIMDAYKVYCDNHTSKTWHILEDFIKKN
jgi:hypothetical protein